MALSVFAAATVLGGWRLSGKMVDLHDPLGSHQAGRNAMGDFRDVIYFPTRAVADGVNPYDSRLEPLPNGEPRYRQKYPVLNLFPLYSPLVLMLFGVFAIPSCHLAAILFYLTNFALLVAFAWLLLHLTQANATIEKVVWLTTAMVVTQAGRATFLGGETSVVLALASVAATHGAINNTKGAGIWLAITSFKPTFGLPLGCLLLAQRAWKTVLVGWGLGFLVGMFGLWFIFDRAGDIPQFTQILQENQRVLNDDPDVNPIRSSTRVDTAGTIVRLLQVDHPLVIAIAFFGVLAICAATLHPWQNRADPEASRLAQVTILTGTVAAIYHLVYDGLLLWGAIAWLMFGASAVWQRTSPRFRWLAGGLLLTTQVNVLPTEIFQKLLRQTGINHPLLPVWLKEAAWTLACTLNGLCLLGVLLLLLWHSVRWRSLPKNSHAPTLVP